MIILTICYIGLFYGNNVYNNAINERVDEYDYKYNTREERTQANSSFEMMVKFKVLDE